MARTTPEAVKLIIEVDEEISFDLAPFIETASMIVDRVCAPQLDDDGDAYYNDTQLEVIERWLAGHCYAVRDPRISYEAVSSLGAKYESKVELHLDNTRYGQMAMVLDTAGGLAKLNQEMKKPARNKPSLTYLGRLPGEDWE